MAQYVVGLDSSLKRLYVWKTTGDPTTLTNWSAQDTGVTFNYAIRSLWAVLDGTDIHIAVQPSQLDDALFNPVAYLKFDTSTDTFSVLREEVDDGANNEATANEGGVSIGVRSDGDVIVLWSHGSNALFAVIYSVREGGTWTGATVNSLDAKAGVVVMGASDRAHFFYVDTDTNDILHRSLDSSNVLDTEAIVDSAVVVDLFHPVGRGISYVDNGNTEVRAPYLDADESITSIRLTSGANPTINLDTAASDNDAEDVNSSVVACMAIDGTDTYLLYSGGGVSGIDQDIYYDLQEDGGSWGTDTEEQDAVTANRMSAGKYTRSATDYIGYLWLDGTTTSYDEITLAAPPAPIPDRLYEVEQHINRAGTY